jgi:prepilin-type processing-associated H-X9-DG protein
VVPGDSYSTAPRIRKVEFTHITDGLTNTTAILERAGLPDHYSKGGTRFEPHDPPAFRTWGNVGLWAISAEMLLNHLQPEAGAPIVNHDNLHGLYSFHPGGTHVAFYDGSVHFLRESIETATMLALITREGGELVDVGALQ